MAITVVDTQRVSEGNKWKIIGTLALDNSYPTGGYAITPAQIGLSQIQSFDIQVESGYSFQYVEQTAKIKAYDVGGFTPAGTVAAPVFTGNALAAHGHNIQVTADEVITVTAGTGVSSALANIPVGSINNVFVTAGGVTGVAELVPVGSVSATHQVSANYTTGVLQFLVADAVTGAKVTYARAAVSTTSAGTPAGTNSAPAFTGTPAAAGAGSEVPNATDLSALTTVEFEAIGL